MPDQTPGPLMAQYGRALARCIENHPSPGYESKDDKAHKARFTNWLLDSLQAGMVAHDKRDLRVALRCYGQVREYLGRLGGFWPYSHVHDMAIALQNALEDSINPRD